MALADWAVRDFTVEPAVQGPQVIINWSFDGFVPTDVGELRLVKKTRSYPEDVSDGTVVHSETNAGLPTPFSVVEYADTSVSDGVVYYYSMFAYVTSESTWYTSDLTSGYALAYTTGVLADLIWEFLPGILREGDDQTEQKALSETTVPDRASVNDEISNPLLHGQKLHFGSHEVPPSKGFLYRLMRLISLEFDRIYALSRHLVTLYDVDKAPLDMLSLIGSRVGVTVDLEASPERRREEIKRAVPLYWIKGTRNGIHSALQVLIPWTIEFDECGDNMGVYNREDRKYWDTANYYLMGTPDDPTTYYPGSGRYDRNFDKVRVFFISPSASANTLSPTQIRKALERVIPKNLQASHAAIPIFVPTPIVESAQISVTETAYINLSMLTVETPSVSFVESWNWTYETKFIMTAASGVTADRLVSDPDWITPRRRP